MVVIPSEVFWTVIGNVILNLVIAVVTITTKRRMKKLDDFAEDIKNIEIHLAKINGSVGENTKHREEHKKVHARLDSDIMDLLKRCFMFHGMHSDEKDKND